NVSSNKRSRSSSLIQRRNCWRAKVSILFTERVRSGAPSKKKFSTHSASTSWKAKSAKARPSTSMQKTALCHFKCEPGLRNPCRIRRRNIRLKLRLLVNYYLIVKPGIRFNKIRSDESIIGPPIGGFHWTFPVFYSVYLF